MSETHTSAFHAAQQRARLQRWRETAEEIIRLYETTGLWPHVPRLIGRLAGMPWPDERLHTKDEAKLYAVGQVLLGQLRMRETHDKFKATPLLRSFSDWFPARPTAAIPAAAYGLKEHLAVVEKALNEQVEVQYAGQTRTLTLEWDCPSEEGCPHAPHKLTVPAGLTHEEVLARIREFREASGGMCPQCPHKYQGGTGLTDDELWDRLGKGKKDG